MADGNESSAGTESEQGATTNGGTPPAGDKTFTQTDLERIVGERLARERGKFSDYGDLKAAAAELAKIKESQATDTEKALKTTAKETEAKVRSELEPRMTRLEVALAKGLPPELGAKVLSAAKRLVGSTREELEADAAEFFSAAPITGITGTTEPPNFDQGARGGSGTGKPTVSSGADMYAQRHKTT
jgi:hypothetical protein